MRRLISNLLDWLYTYDSVRMAKEYVRPLKHLIFGKGDIYLVVHLIRQGRDAAHPVRFVLDVGSAYGDKTLTFLKAFPQSTIHCFEPQTASRRRLIRRTARWRERVVVHDYGLFEENCVVDLRVYSYPDASSILPVPKFMRDEGKTEV